MYRNYFCWSDKMAEDLQIFDKYYNGVNKIQVENTDGQLVTYVKKPIIQKKYITTDGIYDANEEGIDAYSSLEIDVVNTGSVIEKTITQNGTYYAMDDGYPGYYKVIVNGIEKITGEDPDGSGDEVVATTEKNESTGKKKIVIKKIPSSIRITNPPVKTEYVDGENINWSGLVVRLFTRTGQMFTDENYPMGIIPDAELDKPLVVPEGSGDGGRISDLETNIPQPIIAYNRATATSTANTWTTENTYDDAYVIPFRIVSGVSHMSGVVISDKQNVTQRWIRRRGTSEVEDTYNINLYNSFTYDGKTVYYRYDTQAFWTYSSAITWDVPETGIKADKYSCWTALYGDAVGGKADIPVSWLSPYGKGETFTDTFTITVNPAPDSDSENGVNAVTGADPVEGDS